MTEERDIALRPLRRSDLPTVVEWLSSPHVAEWWQESANPADVDRKYGPRIDTDASTEMFVIEAAGTPVGLIQRYRHRDYPDWERAVGVDDAAGIDYLIGVEGLTGQGLGSAAIGRFAADTFEVFSDVEAICAVPQQANVASWRALEKAGFSREQTVEKIESDDPADDGPAFIYMKRRTR